MKKIYAFTLAVLLSLSATSCDSPSKISISRLTLNETYSSETNYEDKDYADYTYQLKIDGLGNLIQSRMSFAFLFEGSYCSSCISLKPSFMRYVIENEAGFYSLDTDRDDPIELYEKMMELKDIKGNNVFSETEGTPTFMFFNNGELIEKLPKTTSMNRYGNLSRILNKRLSIDNSNLIINDSQLGSAKDNEYVLYANNDNEISRLKDLLNESSINYYIYHIGIKSLDATFFSDNNLDSTKTTFRKYLNGEVEKEIILSEQISDVEILNFISEQ